MNKINDINRIEHHARNEHRRGFENICSQAASELRCLRAVAARLSAVLLGVLDGVVHLQEGGQHMASRLQETIRASSSNGLLDVLVTALAAPTAAVALLGLLGLARGAIALQLALGARAGGGLLALRVALGGLAHGGAHGLRGNAGGTAVGRRANSLALGAVLRLAHLLGAADIALGLVAVNLAARARGLLALDLALGALAHGVALGGASGVIALPTALRMAPLLLNFHISGHGHGDQQRQEHKGQLAHSDSI